MATPANRVPVRIARGSKANLDTAIAAGDLKGGEICYATDENGIYVVEGGVLTQAGADLASSSIDALSDVDTTTAAPADGQALVWNNSASQWEPGTISGGSLPATAPPSYDDETGTAGELRYDSDYLYLCIATDSWKRAAIAAWGSTPITDPYWANVAILLKGEGANGGSVFTDDSNNNLTSVLTTNATTTHPTTSTAQFKYGSSSIDFTTGSQSIQLSSAYDSLDIAASQDFTFEWWMYIVNFEDVGLSGNSSYTIGEFVGSTDWSWNLCSTSSSSGEPRMVMSRNFAATPVLEHQTVLPQNQWVHFAVVRASNAVTMYVDGVASTSTYTSSDALDNSSFWSVGPRQSFSNDLYMDEIRLTIGTARYTSNFTPPTVTFPTS